MNLSADQFKAFLRERKPGCGDPEIETVLEFLWSAHSYVNPVDNDFIREKLEKLEPISKALSFEDANLMDDAIAALCFETERLAFLEGVRVGARLVMELEGK